MGTAVADLRATLTTRLETAVIEAIRQVLGIESRKIRVDEQERFTDRMAACQVTLMGQNWLGSLLVLLPLPGLTSLTMDRRGLKPGEKVMGSDLAETLGTVAAAAALRFGRSFVDDECLTVSMPTVSIGTDLAVVFPWGKDFEARLCFSSDKTKFWSILRLSLQEEPT